MHRIRKGYEAQFRLLLHQVGARKLDQGVCWFIQKCRQKSVHEGISQKEALARVYAELAGRGAFRRKHALPQVGFWCDAGLGGLARWLRAAGHIAHWQPGIGDDHLLRQAQQTGAIILTTDSMLMERRLLRDRILPAFWLPPTLKIPAQLAAVFREFHLTLEEPRCMDCGGELRQVSKESLQDRIPPKTYRWFDEYFLCAECDHVFWHGTHWEKISRELNLLRNVIPSSRS